MIVEVTDPAERSRLAAAVLRDLPDWFGIEAATEAYIRDVASLTTLAARDGSGFLALKKHGPRAAEIYVMGVLRAHHRRGIGRALVAAAEAWCRASGIELLQVKTLGPSHDSEAYARTRRFYEALGFTPLEELDGLWPDQPALLLVKRIESGFRVIPVEGIPELKEGDDLAAMIAERIELEERDVVVVAQKAISKIEGRVVKLDGIEASDRAKEIAEADGDAARRIEVILREARRVVRVRAPLVICETSHGFICASAGVDASNAPEPGMLVLLPLDPDASAERLRADLGRRTGREVGVIVTDSFGRPWRQGTTDVAIGAAGVEVLHDLKGERDPIGYELHATVIAVADEVAGAAQLVSGKLGRIPVTVVRGLDVRGAGRATDIPIPPERDLFG